MIRRAPLIPRLQASLLRSALATMRVVTLTGARQTGKTTLAHQIGAEEGRAFHTLDRPETLEVAVRDPEALWQGLDRVTIDEVQRVPELLDRIKVEVDRSPVAGRFLLTGSANLLLMDRIADSLAGRAAYLPLPGLTLAERCGAVGGGLLGALLSAPSAAALFERRDQFAASSRFDVERVVFDGGYPEATRLPDDAARRLWRESYVATYLERDLRRLAQIADLPDFLRLTRLAALRSGQLMNLDGLARDAGLAPSTARRWLNLLEVSFQTVTLRPFTASRTTRLIRSPKLYATDSGLACHLAGIADAAALANSPQLGSLFETFVLQHLHAFVPVAAPGAQLLFWRTASGAEVDFVVEAPTRLLPIEVKTSRTIEARDLRGLSAFLHEHADAAPLGVILYGGEEWQRPARDLLAIPWPVLLAS